MDKIKFILHYNIGMRYLIFALMVIGTFVVMSADSFSGNQECPIECVENNVELTDSENSDICDDAKCLSSHHLTEDPSIDKNYGVLPRMSVINLSKIIKPPITYIV